MAKASTRAPQPLDTAATADPLLSCPQSRQALYCESDHYRCRGGEQTYPILNGVPWLLPEPEAHRADWRNRWHRALRVLQQRSADAGAALKEEASSPPTKQRLAALRDGCNGQHRALLELLSGLDLGMAGTAECYQALGTPLPEQHQLFSYATNVFRDWNWGNSENRASIHAVTETLEEAGVSLSGAKVVVLGAGAGRLSYDLHSALAPARTLALELNPYLAAVGQQVCKKGPLELWEFPLAPIAPEDAAVSRTLRCPDQDGARGLEFVVADALAPPVQPESADLVVTPWFTDVCGAPPAKLSRIINGILKPGGHWLNHGSVAFQQATPEAQLTAPELLATVLAEGFGARADFEHSMHYLCSPASRHGRREQVYSFCVQKERAVTPDRAHPLQDPSWLHSHAEPVPRLPAFATQASATAIHAFLMNLIDGQRSINAMAEVMANRQMMPAADAATALQGFLRKMYEEAQRESGL